MTLDLNAKCPCGSGKTLDSCCLPKIQGKAKAATAEELLRARYTAFTLGEVEYIIKTHHSRTAKDLSREEVEQWSKNSEWLGLTIHNKDKGEATDDTGTIEFHVRYQARDKKKPTDHYERSVFEKEGGQWKFVDAEGAESGTPIRRAEPKVGRNDPCTCGSGKKYKKCCGLTAEA
jgi:SEC-C motif-containing protein